jgi:hypothetical protein
MHDVTILKPDDKYTALLCLGILHWKYNPLLLMIQS